MNAPAAPAMSVGKAALITVAVVLVVAGFLVIGGVLGLVPLYAGFLLLWYFASIDLAEMGALPALAIGAAAGALTAWLLQAGVATWGATGALPALGVIIAAIFCQVMGWLPMVINRAYMLYVTVLAAPLLQAGERFDRVLIVIAAATLYFGGIVYIGKRLFAPKPTPGPAEAA